MHLLGPRFASFVLLASSALFVGAPAFAQPESDKATARQLGQLGQDAFDAKNWKVAEDDFRRADALFHAPTLTLGLARAQAAQGKVVEAWESYNRILLDNVTTPPVFAKALDDAKREIPGVEAKRARLTLSISGASAPRVTIDGAPIRAEALGVERLVDPGQHTITASADGFQTATRTVTIAEGKGETLTIALVASGDSSAAGPTPPPEPVVVPQRVDDGHPAPHPSSTRKNLGFVGLGLGGAGIVVGAVGGILAVKKHSTLGGECPNGTCPTARQADVDSYTTMTTLSTVGFIAGGVLAATGAILVLTAPKKAEVSRNSTGPTFTPYIGYGTAGAVGSF